MTLLLLWQEFRASHPNDYGYTWFCTRFMAFERHTHVSFRNRHEAGAVMQTDYAGHTVQASASQKLPDWIDAQCRALSFIGGVPRAIVCDNLKAGVAKALWFEPTLNATFAAMAEHYDTTILPTRSRRPRDKGKVEGAVLIVTARLRPPSRV